MKKTKSIDYSIKPHECCIDVDVFCKSLTDMCAGYDLQTEFSPFIDKLRDGKEQVFECHSSKDFNLPRKIEDYFFRCLLGEIKKGDYLTKYTTIDNLLRICNTKETAMVSIIGMNDSTEYFYASN